MLHQLIQLSKAFVVMRRVEKGGNDNVEGNLDKNESDLIHKIAFDSIPLKRRLALKLLAEYEGGVTTKALAVALNYQTAVIAAWMAQLNALGVCLRDTKSHGNQGDKWEMQAQYRSVMVKFDKIKVTTESLEAMKTANEEEVNEAWGPAKDTRGPDELDGWGSPQ
jgi:hypothetical protein